jgi:flagellar basal body-associated protein FliL
MDNQFSADNLSTSNITAFSGAKEVNEVKKSKISIIILIVMVIFTCLLVFLSVYKFEAAVPQKTQAVSNYNNQVQQLTK